MDMDKTTKTAKQDKMPWGRFFAWKTRDVALAAVTVIINGYMLLYCSDTLGLSTATVGLLMMVSKLFDGVTDIFAGYLVDNTHSKWGKARPYEICIVLEWICMIALFNASEQWSEFFKCAYVFVMYTLIYSVFNTMLSASQTPYMVRAFNGKRSIITKVASFGGIVSMAGSIVVSMTFPRVYQAWVLTPNAGAAGWRKLILIYAVPLAAFGFLRFLLVKEDPSIDAGESAQRISVREIITMLKTNPYAWSFAGMIGLYNMAVGFGAGTYYFQYIVGDISAFGIVSAMGMLLLPVMIVFPTLIRKLGMSRLFIIMAAVSVAGYVVVFFANSSMAMVYVGIIATNLISLPCSYLQAPGILDIATYNEYNGLHRMEGTSGVVMNFVIKVLNGISAGLTGVLLSAAGYISTTGTEVVTQPDGAIMMIRLLYSLIPGICVAGIILCSLHFMRLEKKLPEIEQTLAERKGNA